MSKIIIEIPDEVKQAFDRASNQDIYGCYYDYNSTIGKAIKNGIVLPKGHGRLIDADEVEKLDEALCATECGCCALDGCFYDRATTIIEADRSEEECK